MKIKGLGYCGVIFALGLHLTSVALAQGAGRTETIDKFGETTTFEYDEASRPEKMTYDTGAYALYTYDGRSRIKAVEHKNSSNTLLRKETNTYDPASRITSRYEGPASGGVTTTFGYDDAGQLTSESFSGYSATYTYDANGNRTNRTVNSVSETYTVDDSDKLTSVTWSQGGNNYAKEYAYHYSGRPTSITYKTNGNTTATETMTWDKESRMLTNSLANASYVYNGFDTRVSKTVSSTTTTFKRAGADPVSPVVSDVVGGSTTTNYLPGISSRTGGTSTFSHSGIKNGILQTNSSQSNTATKRYDAFGNELSTSGTWQTRFDYGGGFGYQRDDESGYKLLGHRYYDPEIGRFLTRDPIKDGRNWFAYCAANPVTGADPQGLQVIVGINPHIVPFLGSRSPIVRYFPPNNGFRKNFPIEQTLEPGSQILRYGGEAGKFATEPGTPSWRVSLPPNTGTVPRLFRVLRKLKVQGGPAEPWFGQLGGGWQYLLPQSISKLIEQGILSKELGGLMLMNDLSTLPSECGHGGPAKRSAPSILPGSIKPWERMA